MCRLEIKRASNLTVFCDTSYVSYDFFGETFVTENVQQQTFSPVFDYVKVHHISNCTADFVKFLRGSIEMSVHVTPHTPAPPVSAIRALIKLQNITCDTLNHVFAGDDLLS